MGIFAGADPISTALNGGPSNWFNHTGTTDATNRIITARNRGAGGHIQAQKSTDGSIVFDVTDDGVETPSLTTDDLLVNNDAEIGRDLLVNRHLTVLGNTALGNNSTGDTFVVTALTNLIGSTAILNSAGTALAAFFVTAGAQTIKLGNQTTPQLMIDVNNTVALFGGDTPLTSASDDLAAILGGALHIASATVGTPAIVQGWRFGTAGTTFSLWVDTATNPSLIWRDDGLTEVFRLQDSSAVYQAVLTGGLHVTGAADFDDDMTLGSAADDEIDVRGTMRVFEAAQFDDAVTVDGATELNGPLQCDSTVAFNGNVAVDAAATFTAQGDATFEAEFIVESSGNNRIDAGSTGIGFFGASQVARPTVVGTLSGSPTLAQLTSVVRSLLAAFDETELGLVTDGTS